MNRKTNVLELFGRTRVVVLLMTISDQKERNTQAVDKNSNSCSLSLLYQINLHIDKKKKLSNEAPKTMSIV